jgi:hypothetical protein
MMCIFVVVQKINNVFVFAAHFEGLDFIKMKVKLVPLHASFVDNFHSTFFSSLNVTGLVDLAKVTFSKLSFIEIFVSEITKLRSLL